jgi:hypothetical protein
MQFSVEIAIEQCDRNQSINQENSIPLICHTIQLSARVLNIIATKIEKLTIIDRYKNETIH